MLNSFFRLNVQKIFCAEISLYIKITRLSMEYDIKQNI